MKSVFHFWKERKLKIHGDVYYVLHGCNITLNVCSSQLNQYIQCNFNQNASKLFYGLRQTDSKVCMKKQKTQNTQNNTREEQSATPALPNFKTSWTATWSSQWEWINWYWWKNRQRNGTEWRQEIDSHMYGDYSDKGTMQARIFFQQMVLEQMNIKMWKNLDTDFLPCMNVEC